METDKFVVTQDILDVLKSVTDKAVLKLVDQYEKWFNQWVYFIE